MSSATQRYVYAIAIIVALFGAMSQQHSKIKTKLDQLNEKGGIVRTVLNYSDYYDYDTATGYYSIGESDTTTPADDEPDTPNIYLGRAEVGDTVSIIDYGDQCDDPVYATIISDTFSMLAFEYIPITEYWFENCHDTDIILHINENEFDIYSDSAGMYLKVYRKEVEK